MLWIVCHNLEIDWKTEEVKMMRCLEEYRKQWRLIQRKSGWQKQKEEEAKEKGSRKETRRKRGKEETKEGKDDRSKESSRKIRNIG